MRYQHKWQDVPLGEVPPDNQANLEATIHRAVELGINHIETARGYGSSERQLGQVLPTFPRDEIIVQTKIQPHEDPAQFVQEFEESLERLNLDCVDLLAIHGINTYREFWWSAREGGCLAAARRLQQDGKARHIGFSSHGDPDVVQAAVEWDKDGGFDYVNLHWYYIYQRNWPAIQAATARDMGVFIISPADKGGMLYDPPEKLVELCQPLHPLVFNCLWCLSHPEVHTLSVGAASPDQFDLQLTALEHLPQAEEILPPIDRRLREAMNAAVGTEVADHYYRGLPTWDVVPGLVNIDMILWLRNLALGWDLVKYAKMRYNLLGNGATWFRGMDARHLGDFDITECVAKSPFADDIPNWLAEAHALLKAESVKRASQADG
jgi:predicted aldo/keto reductase-like oxidoreductase